MASRTRATQVARVLLLLLVATACATDGRATTDVDAAAATAPTALATTAPLVAAEPAARPTALAFDAAPTPAPTTTQTPLPVPTTDPDPTPPPTAIAQGDAVTPGPVTAPTATPQPVTGSQEVLAANGGEVYTLNCARCHAENGLGTAQYSATLIGVGSKYSTEGMIAELTSGHPVTFGFADRLTAEEIASVVAYVKATFP